MKIKFIILFLVLIAGSAFVFFLYENSKDEIPVQPVAQTVPETELVSPTPAPITKNSEVEAKPAIVLQNVPFTSQAPFGNWEDRKQQTGCEEASALMAMAWVNGKMLSPKEAEMEIIAISNYEEKNHGVYEDTSAKDTANWILGGYFNYQNIKLRYDIGIEDIKRELVAGNLVIVPINGRTIGNPYYIQPAPLRHMIIFIGFDDNKQEFIANDPGTSAGKNIRYGYDRVAISLRDYDTGYYEPIKRYQSAMIVVSK